MFTTYRQQLVALMVTCMGVRCELYFTIRELSVPIKTLTNSADWLRESSTPKLHSLTKLYIHYVFVGTEVTSFIFLFGRESHPQVCGKDEWIYKIHDLAARLVNLQKTPYKHRVCRRKKLLDT